MMMFDMNVSLIGYICLCFMILACLNTEQKMTFCGFMEALVTNCVLPVTLTKLPFFFFLN